MDPDSDPAIFVSDLQDVNKKLFFVFNLLLLLFDGTFTSFFKDKKSYRSKKTVGINVFYHFCLMIEGSGLVYLTNGSGSGSRRPKNIWIIRIRIWIRNTAWNKIKFFSLNFPFLSSVKKTWKILQIKLQQKMHIWIKIYDTYSIAFRTTFQRFLWLFRKRKSVVLNFGLNDYGTPQASIYLSARFSTSEITNK